MPGFSESTLALQNAFAFGKVETDGHGVLHTDPVSRLEIAERTHFLQRHRLSALCDLPGPAGGRVESEHVRCPSSDRSRIHSRWWRSIIIPTFGLGANWD